ncbi:diacylglycerol kinase DagK [Candidatus Rickettsiella viridis]|uniref:Diacylglycerol kinase n=1 Tax=Candidatus Rickettsiella viridis TaxID=676208 RepID=A0A2Z5V7J6_9COXI|nr:diacylglycerol kinase [Candidatus Rickettsiella viridis]BBB15457.1 diacylglycerol kinase DagK [Candidatus Rickettsiella viridis]
MFSRLIKATRCSLQGLATIWRHEPAFRLECLLLLVVIIVTLYIDVSKVERLLLIASIGLVLIAEIINSAIEKIVDRIGTEHHVLSGQAKDIGSAAVFLTLLLAIFTWVSILWK